MTEEHFSIFKTILTVITTLFGILTWLQNRRLKQLTNAKLWALFKKQQNSYGMSQAVLRLYKEKHNTNIDEDVIEWASKSESFNQNIFEDIIYHIYSTDSNLSIEKVQKYYDENKISLYDKNLFELLINDPIKLTWLQRTYKLLNIPL